MRSRAAAASAAWRLDTSATRRRAAATSTESETGEANGPGALVKKKIIMGTVLFLQGRRKRDVVSSGEPQVGLYYYVLITCIYMGGLGSLVIP